MFSDLVLGVKVDGDEVRGGADGEEQLVKG